MSVLTETVHAREQRVRRRALQNGLLLRKSHRRDPDADEYGLYVLVRDCAGNRRPGAAAAPNAFWRGEGVTLDQIEAELDALKVRAS